MITKIKLIGLIFIIIGISIPLYILSDNKVKEITYEKRVENKLINKEEYFAILEIPKINLKRELYNLDDEKNHVDKNILIHKNSTFPSETKSNIILAAHSGFGANAYFKNLYKLKINDEAIIYYEGNKYTYEIKEIEYQNKTGELYLKENFKQMLTLITCTYNNKKLQTIYYANIKNIEKIGEN